MADENKNVLVFDMSNLPSSSIYVTGNHKFFSKIIYTKCGDCFMRILAFESYASGGCVPQLRREAYPQHAL
jgi:hypothetical protein